MNKERIRNIIVEIIDMSADLDCDNQEWFTMYCNQEISPEEYDEKSSEIINKLEALETAYDALKTLL